jgi:hypothetical protein
VADDPAALVDLARAPRRDTWLLWGFVITLAALVGFVVFVIWQVAEFRAFLDATGACLP